MYGEQKTAIYQTHQMRNKGTYKHKDGKTWYTICKYAKCEYHVMLCEKHIDQNKDSILMKMDEQNKHRAAWFGGHSSYQGMILLTEDKHKKTKPHN